MAQRGTVLPNGENNLNAVGSQYAASYTTNDTTKFLKLAIEKEIYDNSDKRFLVNKLINMTPLEDVDKTEFSYFTKIWSKETHTVQSATAPGASVTVTLTHAANYYDGFFPFEVNSIVYGSDGVQYIVTAATASSDANSSTFVIKAVNGSNSTAGAVATQFVLNDEFTIQGTLKADGMETLTGSVKPEFIENYNFIQIFETKCEWTRLELAEIANSATTNAMKYEWEESKQQLLLSQFSAFVNGKKGEYLVYDAKSGTSKKAKTMDGFFTIMVDNGAQSANPTVAGAVAAFEALALATNKGGNRMLLGTSAMLSIISQAYKGDKTRYMPNDKIADLDLEQIKIGGSSYVLVPVELFAESAGVLPTAFDRRIICLDMNTIRRKKVKGMPAIELFTTDDVTKGTQNDSTIYAVRSYLSLQMNQVDSSFYMDIQ